MFEQKLEKYFEGSANRLVEKAAERGQSICRAHICDGWATRIFRYVRCGDSTRRFARTTKVRKEYCLQREIFKTVDVMGNFEGALQVVEALPLDHGKGVQHYLSAYNAVRPPLRFESSGMVLDLIVADGPLWKPLMKHVRAQKRLMYARIRETGVLDGADYDIAGLDIDLLEYSDFTLGSWCRQHIWSKSFTWGMRTFITDAYLDDLHLAIKSAHGHSDDLMSISQTFIASSVIDQDAHRTEADAQARLQLWVFVLRGDETWAKRIMLADPRWCPELNRLFVAAWVEESKEGQELLRDILKYFCRFPDFTFTRFASVEETCCCWLGALMVGLDGWFDMCKFDPSVDNYHLLGHWRSKPVHIRRIAALSSVCGAVTDKSAKMLLKDDRFLKHAQKLRDSLNDELRRVCAWSEQVWVYLAVVVGCSARSLRNDSINCALGAVAYIFKNAFYELEYLPLSLTQGDVDANLDQLLEMDLVSCAEEPFSFNLRMCMESGEPRARAKSIVTLATDGPSTSNIVENAHGAGAMFLRHHWTSCQSSLQSRGLISSVQGAFGKSQAQQNLEKAEARVDRIEGSISRSRFGGRQMFLEELAEQEMTYCFKHRD